MLELSPARQACLSDVVIEAAPDSKVVTYKHTAADVLQNSPPTATATAGNNTSHLVTLVPSVMETLPNK
jgi:hypothetical protein